MRMLKQARKAAALREEQRLRGELARTKDAIDAARNHFEQVVDPMLIDCYIYEWNAAQLKYQFLLQRSKNREL